MDVICADSKFDSEVLAFYAEHGVVTPTQDTVYPIRGINHHSNGETGIWLEGLDNPKVPVKNIGMVMHLEPSWNIKRFRTLSGEIVTKEMVEESLSAPLVDIPIEEKEDGILRNGTTLCYICHQPRTIWGCGCNKH